MEIVGLQRQLKPFVDESVAAPNVIQQAVIQIDDLGGDNAEAVQMAMGQLIDA